MLFRSVRVGHFIDHYNFHRPHQGIAGAVPADRFFGAAPAVLETLKKRVAGNALELARQGVPKAPFYLTGQVGGQPFSLHAEGERVILTGAAGTRKEIDLAPPATPVPPVSPLPPAPTAAESAAEPKVELPAPVCPMGLVTSETPDPAEPPLPGTSPLDGGMQTITEAFRPEKGGDA